MERTTPSTAPPRDPTPEARTQRRARLVLALAATVALIALVFFSARAALFDASKAETIGYTELLARAGRNEIARVEIQGERMTLKLTNGGVANAVVSNGESQHAAVSKLAERGIPVEFLARDTAQERLIGALVPLVTLLTMGAVGTFMYKKKRLSHVQTVTSPRSARSR